MNERVSKVYSAVVWPILWIVAVLAIGALTLASSFFGLVFRAVVSILDALVSVLTCDVDHEKDRFKEDWSDVRHLWSRLTGGWRHLVELLFPSIRKARVRREREERFKAIGTKGLKTWTPSHQKVASTQSDSHSSERKAFETIVPNERILAGEVVSALYVDGMLNRLESSMDAGDTSFREENSHIVTPDDYIDHESEPLLLNPCAICGSDAVLYERNDDHHGISVCSNPRCANHYRYDWRNELCKAVTDWNGLNAGHGVIYREHRGGLEESMRTARVFSDFNALCAYLVDLNNNSELGFQQISKGDITFSLYDGEDERIGWKGVLIVGTKTDSRKSGVTGFASTVWDMNRYYAWIREKGIHQ